jgi:phosphoribosyl 1,2-cyclic phosphodiesterase
VISFHQLEPRKTISLQGLKLTPYQLDHPDPCWGYRIESGGKSYAHCVDTECTRTTAAELGEDLALYKNADLALFDAQYTLMEAVEKTNWGHASGPIGLELALREGIKRILFAHHDPGASDRKIADAATQTREYLETYRESASLAGRKLAAIEWDFACEGQEITLK